MNVKRVALAVLWTYSMWVIGELAEFAIGTPAILGLAVGVAGAVLFALDPLGIVWTKPEPRPESPERSVVVDSGAAVAEAPAH